MRLVERSFPDVLRYWADQLEKFEPGTQAYLVTAQMAKEAVRLQYEKISNPEKFYGTGVRKP